MNRNNILYWLIQKLLIVFRSSMGRKQVNNHPVWKLSPSWIFKYQIKKQITKKKKLHWMLDVCSWYCDQMWLKALHYIYICLFKTLKQNQEQIVSFGQSWRIELMKKLQPSHNTNNCNYCNYLNLYILTFSGNHLNFFINLWPCMISISYISMIHDLFVLLWLSVICELQAVTKASILNRKSNFISENNGISHRLVLSDTILPTIYLNIPVSAINFLKNITCFKINQSLITGISLNTTKSS